MRKKPTLFGGVSTAALILAFAASTADAKTVKRHHVRREEAPAVSAEVQNQISALSAQLAELKAWRDAQAASQAQTQAQVQQLQTQLADAQARAQAAEAQVQAQIQTIPGAVDTAVKAAEPKHDKLYVNGVTVQFGGFVAAESVTRSKNEQADIASSFSGIPFANSPLGHTNETRLTARQSRVSALVQGRVDDSLLLSAYGEADFLGAAQTANSNETNSYTPRMRVFYTTIDWDSGMNGLGLHMLAGQNWSLATQYKSGGLNPRSELSPLTIDAQYVPGFVFTRQPQVRLTADLNKTLWFGVSAENPQTTYYTSGKYDTGVSVVNTGAAGSGFNAANTLSINDVPDVIGKVALTTKVAGHGVQLEGFGIYRDFYARITNNGAAGNRSVAGGGVGGDAFVSVIPNILDLQASGIVGRGVGRYGASQLSDATIGPDGSLHPIREWALLAGGTLHAGPKLDVYAYAGEERASTTAYTDGTVYNGYGNINYVNAGCDTEASALSCVGNTHYVEQVTAGFWHKPYVGKFGKFQWGVQYSYTERHAFPGAGATTGSIVAPETGENMVLTSIRYYPFDTK